MFLLSVSLCISLRCAGLNEALGLLNCTTFSWCGGRVCCRAEPQSCVLWDWVARVADTHRFPWAIHKCTKVCACYFCVFRDHICRAVTM